jgi:hypothetical protein
MSAGMLPARTPNVRATVQEVFDGLQACRRTAGRRWPLMSAGSTISPRRSLRPVSTTRPSCGRRRPGRRFTSRYPCRGRSWRGARANRIRTTMPTALPLRCSGDWRRCGRIVGGTAAAHAGARGDPVRRASLKPVVRFITRPRQPSTASRAGTGRRPSQRASRDGQCAVAAAHDGLRILRAEFVALVERVTEHLAAPDPNRCRVNVCGRCAPSGDHRHRRDRAAHGFRQQ